MLKKLEMFLCWIATVVVFISTGIITFITLCVIDCFYTISWFGAPYGILLTSLLFAGIINIDIKSRIKDREQ